MNYLLDTDICVHLLRGDPVIHARAREVGLDAIALSVVTLVELRYGAEYSADTIRNHTRVDTLVEGILARQAAGRTRASRTCDSRTRHTGRDDEQTTTAGVALIDSDG